MQLMDVVQKTQHPLGTPEHLSTFVIGHLFNALVGAALGQIKTPNSCELVNNPEKMLMWYKAYRYVTYEYIVKSASLVLCAVYIN